MDARTNTSPIDSQLSPAARKFLEETTMKSIFGISDEALDAVMALAYQLYQVGRYAEAEVLCRGLIAADHRYWWSYSLYAATLHRLRSTLARLKAERASTLAGTRYFNRNAVTPSVLSHSHTSVPSRSSARML